MTSLFSQLTKGNWGNRKLSDFPGCVSIKTRRRPAIHIPEPLIFTSMFYYLFIPILFVLLETWLLRFTSKTAFKASCVWKVMGLGRWYSWLAVRWHLVRRGRSLGSWPGDVLSSSSLHSLLPGRHGMRSLSSTMPLGHVIPPGNTDRAEINLSPFTLQMPGIVSHTSNQYMHKKYIFWKT